MIISHTTETAFARRARAHALESGAEVVSITAQGRGWPEAVETVAHERAETYTVSYLAALLVLARLSLAVGEPGFDDRQLSELPDRVRAAAQVPTPLDAAPERLLVLAGVGPGAVTAREGALKLREGARFPAEGYEAEYLLHGTAVPLGPGDGLIAIQPSADRFGMLELLAEAAASEGMQVTTIDRARGTPPGARADPADGSPPEARVRSGRREGRRSRHGDRGRLGRRPPLGRPAHLDPRPPRPVDHGHPTTRGGPAWVAASRTGAPRPPPPKSPGRMSPAPASSARACSGPSAMGPLAIAVSAVGAIAIGRLVIAEAVIRKLKAEEIEIGSLKVRELEVGGRRFPEEA